MEETPHGFPGWTVQLRQRREPKPGRVRIEPARRTIILEGGTQGEIRRAMVVLMRLVDRKYPHVGRFVPLMTGTKQWYLEQGKKPWDVAYGRIKDTSAFFQSFEDANWLVKPLLRPEYEKLYARGNMDFAGRYEMRGGVYIFEPTYGDDFVYGYDGPGTFDGP